MEPSPDWVTSLGVPAAVFLILVYVVGHFVIKVMDRLKESKKGKDGDSELVDACNSVKESISARLDTLEEAMLRRMDDLEAAVLTKVTAVETLSQGVKTRIIIIAQQTDDLHRLHDKTDEDGVPVWYVRRSLGRSVEALTEAVRSQTIACNEIIGLCLDIRNDRRDPGNISRIGTGTGKTTGV